MDYNKSLGTGRSLSCLYFFLLEASLFSLYSYSLGEEWVSEILALIAEVERRNLLGTGCNQAGGLLHAQICALISQSRNQPFTIWLILPFLESARNLPQLPAHSRNLFILLKLTLVLKLKTKTKLYLYYVLQFTIISLNN